MPEDQSPDQQDPEQRIAELERQVEAAKHAAGRPPSPNAPGLPPQWPNAPGLPPQWPNAPSPYEFSPQPSKSALPKIIALISFVVVGAVIFAVSHYLTQPSRPTQPSRSGPSGGPSTTTSASTPNTPTWTQSFSDDAYKAYGEVPIPGNQTLHLPAGQVAITFHAETASGSDGPLSIPDLKLDIDPPTGVADPTVTESFGGTTSVDNVAWRRVWIAQIPQDGDYQIVTDGQVGPFIWARLAFGHVEGD